ncbi:hypothetical protein GCM10011391_05770 [Pullulanibacillus camelliae]|uniref:Uncharacterized protein n=1 Tax=Pullulanibacillus camelliae TaxID=1707096 RepID=A0A8J2VLP0_9BACL|nr:hypothetical protein GCM10011391_05770 [Pullulanibacillus camelliae]
MENYIKEVKNGFNFDRMCSHSFQVNEVRMLLKPAGVQPNELASYTFQRDKRICQSNPYVQRSLKWPANE